MTPEQQRAVWTVGHSNHGLGRLLELLVQHHIEVVADVRSWPFSAYTPHFNRSELEIALPEKGFKYVFLGAELGGRPQGNQYYDENDHVRYDRLAGSANFRQGIERLIRGAAGYRVVVMCAEEDPTDCHRRLLVGKVLAQEGILLHHIRGDGSVMDEAKVDPGTHAQLDLLGEVPQWRSTRSVSRRSLPRNSSNA